MIFPLTALGGWFSKPYSWLALSCHKAVGNRLLRCSVDLSVRDPYFSRPQSNCAMHFISSPLFFYCDSSSVVSRSNFSLPFSTPLCPLWQFIQAVSFLFPSSISNVFFQASISFRRNPFEDWIISAEFTRVHSIVKLTLNWYRNLHQVRQIYGFWRRGAVNWVEKG